MLSHPPMPAAPGRLRLRVGRSRLLPHAVAGALLAAVLGAAVAGCGGKASASFDPGAPCSADVRQPGAYPALEARVPRSFEGRGPDRLDSGRNCTAANLGTLARSGIGEVHFAGGLWELGRTSGVTLAVFEGDGLSAPLLGEWYEAGARDARNTTNIEPTRPVVAGRQAYRLDTLNGESRQTVIVWPSADSQVVQALIAADAPEEVIQAGLRAFE